MTAQTTDSKIAVSILIPVKNEAGNLPRCLASVAWADEIIVVDSHSIDGTRQIAESYGAKVVQFDFSGTYPRKKNWALDNLTFRHDWIFILDADEVLPPSVKGELAQIVAGAGDADQLVGYWINRRFFFMDKWLKHAYFPNWNMRFFKHKLGRYEKLTDLNTESGDNEVHEQVIVQGKTGYLKSLMDHYAFPTVDIFVEKHNRYSNWEARVAASNGHANTTAHLTGSARSRRQLKMMAAGLPCRPLLRFLYVYFWQKGFLDGMEGYYFARLHAYYEFLTLAKTFELKKKLGQRR